MLLYRFSTQEYAGDLSGGGGVFFGGRWNEQGVACIYTSTHISLAIVETLANKRWQRVPSLCLATLELTDTVPMRTVLVDALPSYWQAPVPYDASTIAIGTDFLRKGSEAALRVPSSLVPEEFNVILSPHRAAAVGLRIVEIKPYLLDERLIY